MNKEVQEYSLNIHFIGFRIPRDLIKNDEIKIKISSRPEHNKDSLSVNVHKRHHCNQISTINIRLPINHNKEGENEENEENKEKEENKEGTEKIMITFKNKTSIKGERDIAITYITQEELIKILSEKQDQRNQQDQQGNIIYDEIRTLNIYQQQKIKRKNFIKHN